MRIKSVESCVVALPFDMGGPAPRFAGRPWDRLEILLVRVETQDGLVGWGEAFGHAAIPSTRAALDTIVAGHPGEQVLVVSHKATIRLLVADLLGLDVNAYRRRLDQQPASLNILDVDTDGHAQLVLYNDVSHYGPWHGHPDIDMAESHRR